MTTLRERAKVIAEIAASTGRSRASVFRVLAPTWGLEGGEVHRVHEHLARMPAPRETELARDARAVADDAEATKLSERVVSDITTFREWRDLKRTNPHAAALALLRTGTAEAIQRGRELDEPTDDGPEAA